MTQPEGYYVTMQLVVKTTPIEENGSEFEQSWKVAVSQQANLSRTILSMNIAYQYQGQFYLQWLTNINVHHESMDLKRQTEHLVGVS